MVSTRRSTRVPASNKAEVAPQAAAANGGVDAPAAAPSAGEPPAGDPSASDAPAAVAAAAAVATNALGSPPSAKRRKQEPSGPPSAHPDSSPAAARQPGAGTAAPPATLNGSAPASNGGGDGPDVLDGFRKLPQLRAALETLQTRVDDSAVFLRPSSEVAAAAREVAKLLYQQYARLLLEGGGPGAGTRAERRALRNSSLAPLPELHTDETFDPEQIWLQLEPATEAAVRRVRRLARIAEPLAGGAAGLLTAEAAAGIDRLLSGGLSSDAPSTDEDEEGEGEEELSDSEGREGEQEEDEDEDAEEGRKRAKKARTEAGGVKKKQKGGAPPPGGGRLEDRFFRLSDLERYVEDAERRAMAGSEEGDEELMGREGEGEGVEGEEEDGDAGLFEGLDDSDDEEAAMERLLSNTAAAAGKKKGKDAAEIRYQDFFGGGGGGGDDDDDDEGEEDESGDEDGDEDDEGGRGRGLLESGDDLDEDEEDMEGDEEEEDEDGGAARRRSGKDAGPRDAHLQPSGGGATKRRQQQQQQQQQQAAMSSHERRLARLQERVAELETEALADKAWFLTGEAAGGSRPLNSALELDMDFENTAKPAPVQTEEMTHDLEAMIRKRIADQRFDDVVRVVPQPLETKKKAIDLDDTKAKSGLGELYEQDYVRQVTGGTAEDKDEKLRQEARALFKALCGKLDALCRFHFAPKPVVEDMTVRSEVPAIAMEEAAPVAVSKAAMQLPSEVYQPGTKDGRPLAEGELTKEERKQRRARKKRQRKAREESKESERRARAVAAGGTAEVVGRKSDSKVVAGKGVKVAEGAGAGRHGRTDIGTSSAVFAKLAAEQQAAVAAAAGGGGGGGGGGKVARELKKNAAGGGSQTGGKSAVAFKL